MASSSNALKMVMLGTGGVGKSSLTLQFVCGFFVEVYDPTIEDSYRRTVAFDDVVQECEIMDTSGSEHFVALRDLYMRNGEAFMVVYSTTSKSTMAEAREVLERLQESRDFEGEQLKVLLVGNKSDMVEQRQVSYEEGSALAKQYGCCGFMETSAKKPTTVEAAFHALIREAVRTRKLFQSKKKSEFCSIL